MESPIFRFSPYFSQGHLVSFHRTARITQAIVRGENLMRSFLSLLTLALIPFSALAQQARDPQGRKPNIVYILADDLGIGDVSCLNPKSKIQTPNVDRLAKEG